MSCGKTSIVVKMNKQILVMDGFTAARKLREEGFSQSIREIVAEPSPVDFAEEEKKLEALLRDEMAKPNLPLALRAPSSMITRGNLSQPMHFDIEAWREIAADYIPLHQQDSI